MTGGDRISCRPLYGNLFEYVPEFKLWLGIPTISGTEAIWRRIRVIEFPITIPPEEQDKRLADKLIAELPGSPQWAMQGCMEWGKIGLAPPASVFKKRPLTATFYSSILSPIPLGYVSGDIDAFVEFLHLCHDEHQPKSKNDSYLFSPAIFDPNKSTEENRGKENILYLRHVVLDFENGELQPETLPKLFPDLQMVVTNTYRHTHDKPRFRAVLFTDEPMSPETYDLIYNFVADKLVEAGYSVERPGKKLKGLKSVKLSSLRFGLGKKRPHKYFLFSMPSTMCRRQLLY